jgi:hypothetical protein
VRRRRCGQETGLDDLLTIAAVSNRLTVNGVVARSDNTSVGTATVRRAVVGSMLSCTSGSTGSLGHGASRAISGITRSSAPGTSVVGSPAGLAGEDSIVEAVEGGGTGTVDERGVAEQWDVVD